MIHPIFKTTELTQKCIKWIIEHFPEDYEEHDYVELIAGSAGVLLNKRKPKNGLEVLNEPNIEKYLILKSLRNRGKEVVGKLKKLEQLDKVFEAAKDKKEFKNEMDLVTNELFLRIMSRAGNKKNFSQVKDMSEHLIEAIARLQNVHILNKPIDQVVKAFDSEEKNALFFINEVDLNDDSQLKLYNVLSKIKSKLIILGKTKTENSKLYKSWSFKKQDKDICLWKNY